MSKRTSRAVTKVPPATPGHVRPGYSEETKDQRLLRYADDRKALSEKYSKSKAETAVLRDELANAVDTVEALQDKLANVQAQSGTGTDKSLEVYRLTIEKMTRVITSQTEAGAKLQSHIIDLETRVGQLESDLDDAASRADAKEEHAKILDGQREHDLAQIDFLSAKLASAESELAKRVVAGSAAAPALSPVEESTDCDDDTAVEPGTPELSDRDDSEGEENDPSSEPGEDRKAASAEREAAASDPILAAALAGIDAHNDFMFKVTHGVKSQDEEDEANRGLTAPEILARSALEGAQLGDQKAAKFAARLESFESSRERAAVDFSKTVNTSLLGGGEESTKPTERSPKHDAVERTLNQLPSTPWVGSSAVRLVQASASAVANLLPRGVGTPAKAMTLNLDSDDDDDPGNVSGGGVKLPAKPEPYQRRVFGVSDTPDPAVARGPRRPPSSAGSMSLDLDDLDDVSAVSFGSSHHYAHSDGSLYDEGLRAGMDPPAAGFGDRDLSVAQQQLRELRRQADAAVRTAEATEKRAETEGESLRMSQHTHELMIAKQDGTGTTAHDSNDSKCMRMLVNSCAVGLDEQPKAALADKPTPDSLVVVDKWIPTITKRTLEPVDRAEKYGLNFTPTKEIIKLTSQCRFGTDGLYPDMFITFSYENAREFEKNGGEKFNKKGLDASDLTTSVKDYEERCETMADWVESTLSPLTAQRMLEWFKWGCKLARKDQTGDWSLSDLKLLHLKVLDEFQLERETTLDAIKSVCRGDAASGDESYYPKLSKVREIATRPSPGGRGTLHPPAWISFLTENVLGRDGSVRYASRGLEVRDKQLKSSEYDQKRKLRDDREKEKAKELARMLCNKGKKSDVKDGARGSGNPSASGEEEAEKESPPPQAAPGPSELSEADLAAVNKVLLQNRSRKHREAERGKGMQKLGKLAVERKARVAEETQAGRWITHDVTCLRNKDQYAMAGLMVGPSVRAAGNSLTGQRLLIADDLVKLKDQKIHAEGYEVCIRSTTHDDCPFKDDPSKCRYHHLDSKLHPPHGLPEQLRTLKAVAALPPEMRMFGISLGGFKCETVVPVEARDALIKKVRDSASGPVSSPAHLPPATIYAMVAEGNHPNEIRLKQLMNGTGTTVGDLHIPAPVRAFDEAPAFEDDVADLGRSNLLARDGEVWRKHVLARVSSVHAGREIFVSWAAKRMSMLVEAQPEKSMDDAFSDVMADGESRGSRILGHLCSAYAPRSQAAQELVDDQYCSASGVLLLAVELIQKSVPKSAEEREIQIKFGGARYAVELFGGKFEAMDAGHVILDGEGVEHSNQCVLCSYSIIDRVSEGAFPELSERQTRGAKIAAGFRAQASAALERLGPSTGSMTVAVAELRADIRDLLKWNDHDSRLVINFGRGLQAIHQFSSKSWNSLRLIIVATAGDGLPVRLYVINGPTYTDKDGWTAFILVYQHHAMPMVARSSQFTGEQGGSRFLRHALTYGVSPSDLHARDWSNLCPDLRGGGSEPLFPADEIMRGIVRDRNEDSKVFRAGRANSRRTAVELLEHRLSPNIASWVKRFFKSSKVESGSDADFEGGVMANKLSSLNDLNAPLSLRQLSFKAALIQSKVAQQVNLGQFSSTKLEHDFIAWIVRQVEAREDLSMDNRPSPSEVDWRYWLRNLSRLAVHSGIHVEVASVILSHLHVATAGGTSEGDDASDFLFPPAHPVYLGPGVDYDETVTDDALSSDDDENGSSSVSAPPTKGSKMDVNGEDEWHDCNEGWFDDEWYDARDSTPWFSGVMDPSLDVARGGKSRERRLAELMTGPVVIPDPIESSDAAHHRPFTFDEIMALEVTAEESNCAEKLCQAAVLKYSEPDVMVSGSVAEAEFLKHVVDTVALGDELTLMCGSYRRAIAVFRKQWWSTHERFAIPERIENIRGLCLDELVDYIKMTADRGVEVRTGADPPSSMLGVRNHQSVDENATEMILKVWDDFKRCGAFLVSDRCKSLLDDVQIAPMSRVDKTDDEGFVDNSEGGRPIYDGRHGKKSLNKKTPAAPHPPAASPTHLALMFYIVWLCLLLPGVPVLCCKRDVKAAFKLIWIAISDSNWFGARFPSTLFSPAKRAGANFTWASMFILFIVLQFGWSESPSEYGVYGWAISMTHRSLGPFLACQLPCLAYMNLVFVDDAAIIEPDLFGRAEASCVAYNWSLFQVLGTALNLKKLLVDGMLAFCHIFWGVTYHLERAAEGVQYIWVELTRSKKMKAVWFMKLKFAQPGERAVLLVDHQRLAGNVQWWSVCAPALRGLLGSFYSMSRSESDVWLSPTGSAEEKELAWQEYDDAKTLLAMLVEMGAEQPSYFQSRIIDSLDFYDLAHIPRGLGVHVRYIGSDSNGHETGGIMSGIDYSDGTWTFARAKEYAPTLLARLGVPSSEITKDLIIFVTELLVVICLAAEHGHKWTGFIVASIIDNDNSKEAITTRRSRNRYVRYLLLVLVALEFRYKFRLVAYFVGTKANWLLDGIGRFERFQDRTDDEVRAMIQEELIDVHVPGLEFEPLTKLLKFFTEGGSVLTSFALPDGSVDHIAAKYTLSKSSSVETKAWSDQTLSFDDALELGRVGFGGLCSGVESLELAYRKKGVGTAFFIESDRMKFNFLDQIHPKMIHRCLDVLGSEYESWFFPRPLALPRIVGGGPPCVFAASSGRRRGVRDDRSKPFTQGVAKVVASLDANRPSTVWAVIVENVAGVAWVDDGEALVMMLKSLYVLGLALTPRPIGGVKNIQVVCARELGGRAVRPRLMGYLEKRWMIRWLGHAPLIEYPKAVPSALHEILEPDESVPVWLIVPGRFTPFSGTKLDERGIKLAGYIDYGGPDDPVVRGSLVRLDDSATVVWRVMLIRGPTYDLMKATREDPIYRKGVTASTITLHLRERRRVNHVDGGAGIITKFGEPGLVGGPGHQLVLREIGVTWLTARELWRLQGGSVAEQDARFDAFVKANPLASYEDLAGAAGDAIASVWADAAADRSSTRCALLVAFARKFVASWVTERWRSRRRP